MDCRIKCRWLLDGDYGAGETAPIRSDGQAQFRGFRPGRKCWALLVTASLLVGPDGRVFCFEPVRRNLAFLRKHIELNHLTNCTVWDAAVGRTEGVAAFNPESTPFTGHLTEEQDGTLLVKVVALDKLVASGELPPPDLIKCDIEGGEFDALSGASGILNKYGPAIFLATHSPEVHRKCCKLLTDFGYRLRSVDKLPVEETRELVAVRQSA